ncbi:MAG TPA: ABC transporter permease [Methylomirabilota bacterium]|jgi:peptide/nickel transport system permease protein|nr:ABC transporter permease [Methylomirabilota bacterium]
MSRYVARRLGLMVVAVLGVTLISFVISHAVPADPIVSNLGQQASQRPEIVQAFKEKWGLDRPLHLQYLAFLANLARGELGTSINTRRAITKDLAQFLPATLELATTAVLFALAAGVPLGIFAAIQRDGPVDHVARLVSLVGVSIPIFWLATVSLVLFYATLHWTVGPGRLGPQVDAPARLTGLYTVDAAVAADWKTFRDAVAHLVLPGLVLASSVMGLVTRVTRSSMLDALSQDYLRTARAKGLPESGIVARHALKNALIPTVTVLGLAYGGLLSGAVMTETIFAWPGLGRYAFQSAVTNDFPAIMGVTFVIGVMYTLVNLLVDLLYGWLDPQIRYS